MLQTLSGRNKALLERTAGQALVLSDIVESLHKQRGQLDSIRKELSAVYLTADYAIANEHILFEPINQNSYELQN